MKITLDADPDEWKRLVAQLIAGFGATPTQAVDLITELRDDHVALAELVECLREHTQVRLEAQESRIDGLAKRSTGHPTGALERRVEALERRLEVCPKWLENEGATSYRCALRRLDLEAGVDCTNDECPFQVPTLDPAQPWDVDTVYAADDVVTHCDIRWRAQESSQAFEPGYEREGRWERCDDSTTPPQAPEAS